MECLKKCRTEGLLVSSTNCGFIVGFRELFHKESISQVASFYIDTLKRQSWVPKYLIYDDGCHLKSYFENRNFFPNSSQYNNLKQTVVVVDRFHFKGISKIQFVYVVLK
jgi:hypothetical protein